MKFTKIKIKNYRSFLDIEISLDSTFPTSICGENNIGKTNFLRALNVFFNHLNNDSLFNPEEDIPFHIYHGSRGGGTKTELTGYFSGEEDVEIFVKFDNKGEVSYKKNRQVVSKDEVINILDKFQYIFIESHNINIPDIISTMLETKGLLPLDKKRSTQSNSLRKLDEFIKLSQKALKDIEKGINECFKEFTNFDNILAGKKIIINFAEFQKLRDAIKNMTSLTLDDGNSHDISKKGSGAQRAVLLAMMKFIAKNSKDKHIIWGIDEPESFLQPKFQRKVFSVLKEMNQKQNQLIVLTTHSQNFIDLTHLNNTYLFQGSISSRQYARKPNKYFSAINTSYYSSVNTIEKANAIRDHLGINANDNWQILPYTILVKGEGDKKYLETLFEGLELNPPNIIYSSGASKMVSYLQYVDTFAKDLQFKPKILCILDYDREGKESLKKLLPSRFQRIDISVKFIKKYQTNVVDINSNNNDYLFCNESVEWEIEDFIPPKLILKAANILLANNQYKEISEDFIEAISKDAYKNNGILNNLNDFSRLNNNNMTPFNFNSQRRKKELCKIFFEKISS